MNLREISSKAVPSIVSSLVTVAILAVVGVVQKAPITELRLQTLEQQVREIHRAVVPLKVKVHYGEEEPDPDQER